MPEFLVHAFYWENWAITLIHDAVIVGMGWLLTRFGGSSLWKKPAFWALAFVGIFLGFGIIGGQSLGDDNFVVEMVNVRTLPRENDPGSNVLMKVAVSNTGAPSVVSNWHAYVREPNGEEIRLQINATDKLRIGDDLLLDYDDLIYRRTTQNRLVSGERARGWLPAAAPLSPRRLNQPGVVYRIVIGDTYGNQYSTTYTVEPSF